MTKEEQLIEAATDDDFKTVKALLITDKPDVNIADLSGNTALHYAIRYYENSKKMKKEERMKIIELLIKCGADVYKKDNDSSTPFDYAIRYEHLDIVKFIFNCKAYLEKKINHTNLSPSPFHCVMYLSNKNSAIGIFIRENIEKIENELNEHKEQAAIHHSISTPRCSR